MDSNSHLLTLIAKDRPSGGIIRVGTLCQYFSIASQSCPYLFMALRSIIGTLCRCEPWGAGAGVAGVTVAPPPSLSQCIHGSCAVTVAVCCLTAGPACERGRRDRSPVAPPPAAMLAARAAGPQCRGPAGPGR